MGHYYEYWGEHPVISHASRQLGTYLKSSAEPYWFSSFHVVLGDLNLDDVSIQKVSSLSLLEDKIKERLLSVSESERQTAVAIAEGWIDEEGRDLI